MRTMPLLVAGLFACAMTACGSAQSSDGDSAGAAPRTAESGEITADASPESRDELGVVAWSAKDDATGSSVQGYDGKNNIVVELRRTMEARTDKQRVYTYVLRQKDASAKMEISVEERDKDTGVLSMLENAFVDHPEYARTFELIGKDFEAKSQGGGSLTTSSVRPLGGEMTTDKCADLVACAESKLVRIGTDTNAALTCIGLPLTVGAGVAFDLMTGKDPAPGAAQNAGNCGRAQEATQKQAEESAKACRINCVQL